VTAFYKGTVSALDLRRGCCCPYAQSLIVRSHATLFVFRTQNFRTKASQDNSFLVAQIALAPTGLRGVPCNCLRDELKANPGQISSLSCRSCLSVESQPKLCTTRRAACIRKATRATDKPISATRCCPHSDSPLLNNSILMATCWVVFR
jgi:hypothetical protein